MSLVSELGLENLLSVMAGGILGLAGSMLQLWTQRRSVVDEVRIGREYDFVRPVLVQMSSLREIVESKPKPGDDQLVSEGLKELAKTGESLHFYGGLYKALNGFIGSIRSAQAARNAEQVAAVERSFRAVQKAVEKLCKNGFKFG